MIEVLGLMIGDNFCRSNSKKAVIDSGTSFLIISPEGFASLSDALIGICQFTYVGIFCPCVTSANVNQYPDITVYGYGAKFVISPYDYILAQSVIENE